MKPLLLCLTVILLAGCSVAKLDDAIKITVHHTLISCDTKSHYVGAIIALMAHNKQSINHFSNPLELSYIKLKPDQTLSLVNSKPTDGLIQFYRDTPDATFWNVKQVDRKFRPTAKSLRIL